ncbi:MAG: hypothetical protein J6T08_05275, partial [Lentisphaeria bacterium]|nr:hypothetical protein [Lentisphaeria bacterium]
MKTVKPRNFWSKGFVFLCFVPMLVFTILHAVSGSWINATWQAVTLLILCANNYLLCLNDTL